MMRPEDRIDMGCLMVVVSAVVTGLLWAAIHFLHF